MSPQVVQEAVGFLHRLATASKDCAVGMCRAGAREAVAKALDKHGPALPLAPALLELVSDCERHAALYRKLTGSILAGCIQVGWVCKLPGLGAWQEGCGPC